MQYASGVNLPIFWATSILWDVLTNCITISIIIIMLILGQHEHWKSFSELGIVFLILLFYNIAMMPVICVLSLIFTKPTMGMNVISIFNFSMSKSSKSKFIECDWKFNGILWTKSILIQVVLYTVADTLKFLPTYLLKMLWAYPICTLVDGASKLPRLHRHQIMCEKICEETHCDWDQLCSMQKECCCK